MKSIWAQCIIILSGCCTAFGIWLLVLETCGSYPVPSAIWNNALIERKSEIAKSCNRPKLLIVSGSSAIAGISAQQMEADLGIRCVNFGSSAGFGIHFILWASKRALKPGDAVLLPLEYEHYDYKLYENVDVTLLHVIASEKKEYFSELHWIDAVKLKLAYNYGYVYRSLFTRYNPFMPPESWGVPLFDRWGDIVIEKQVQSAANRAKIKDQRSRILVDGISRNSESWSVLREYVQWCRNNDIVVLATWPNICYWPDYEHNEGFKSALEDIVNFWDTEDVPVVGLPRDAMFPQSNFHDTMYHLNQSGIRIRTKKLIEDLSKCLANDFGGNFINDSYNN